MPSPIEDIMADFCELSKQKKIAQSSVCQTKLKNAYQGECTFRLLITEKKRAGDYWDGYSSYILI